MSPVQMAEPEPSRSSRMRSSSRPEEVDRRYQGADAGKQDGDLREYLEQKKQRLRKSGMSSVNLESSQAMNSRSMLARHTPLLLGRALPEALPRSILIGCNKGMLS